MKHLLPKLLVSVAALLLAHIADAHTYILYSGSYTSGRSKGIYAWRFNSDNGEIRSLGLAAETSQPAHIWISPSGRFLYAVNWQPDSEGMVSAFRIDRKDAHLTLLNQVSSHGIRPNQIVLDPSGRIAVTVNYRSGTVAAYKVPGDGKLSDAFFVERHGEPNEVPKAHGIEFSKDGTRMYVAELGLDRVYTYRVDARKPLIAPVDPPFVQLHAGAAPRRLQLSADDRFLYVNHEADSEVSVLAIRGDTLTEIQKISTLPAGTEVKNTTAEVMIDPAGRHLYVSNRGHDSIAVYSIDPKAGTLTLQANVPAGGNTPRNIRLDPSGHYLFSANENGGTITLFKVDAASGMLQLTGMPLPIDTPGGMYFLSVK